MWYQIALGILALYSLIQAYAIMRMLTAAEEKEARYELTVAELTSRNAATRNSLNTRISNLISRCAELEKRLNTAHSERDTAISTLYGLICHANDVAEKMGLDS